MSEIDSFLAVIRGEPDPDGRVYSPDDDTPRLIFADWLEEHATEESGYAARATFIRCQIAAVRCPRCNGTNSLPVEGIVARMQCWECAELRRRERELLGNHGYGWADGLLGDGWKTDGRSKDGDSVTVRFFRVSESRSNRHWTDEVRLSFSRGFLSKVSSSWEDLSQHLDSILADPWVPGLDEVVITDTVTIITDQEVAMPGYFEDRWPGVRKWEIRGGMYIARSEQELAEMLSPQPLDDAMFTYGEDEQ